MPDPLVPEGLSPKPLPPHPAATANATPITAGQTITTTAPTSSVAVTVPNTGGVVNFNLVVTDNLGQQSTAAVASVTIQGPPTAVLNASPSPVVSGGAITLDGSKSTTSGSIASYTFTFVQVT